MTAQSRDELSTLITNSVGSASQNIIEILSKETDALHAELAVLKAGLEKATEWQLKNDLIIKIGAVSAIVAAGAAIIGLFI